MMLPEQAEGPRIVMPYIQPINFEIALSPIRAYPLRFHPVQAAYWASPFRFNIVPAGRRSGKTELAKRKVVTRAMAPPHLGGSPYHMGNYFVSAPTFNQVKRIYWQDLKDMIPKEFVLATSESDLWIKLINLNTIYCMGLDKPERMEGFPWDGGIVDEIANVKPSAWETNIRPALSDRGGWCDLIGVPEGRNHYYELDLLARTDTTGEWGHFHWISADILRPEEIAAVRATMDEITYYQEYEASFVNYTGRAYHAFNEEHNVRQLKHLYNPTRELKIMMDFNISPGTAAIGQDIQYRKQDTFRSTLLLDEVFIKRHSNTIKVCDKIIELYGKKHFGPVTVYGDSTGGAGGSAKILGSDWEIIGKKLRGIWGDKVKFRVRRKSPRERDRLNATNSLLQSVNKDVRLYIDQSCGNIIRDFEGVILLDGGSGEIDKKSTPLLTHLSDAIGYFADRDHPLRSNKVRDMKI
ncbi:MAG: hypothetical protein KAS39_01245 [Actinomycetia bacterium]|nr:hypothetical protein [Actinomycetes bacterium]